MPPLFSTVNRVSKAAQGKPFNEEFLTAFNSALEGIINSESGRASDPSSHYKLTDRKISSHQFLQRIQAFVNNISNDTVIELTQKLLQSGSRVDLVWQLIKTGISKDTAKVTRDLFSSFDPVIDGLARMLLAKPCVLDDTGKVIEYDEVNALKRKIKKMIGTLNGSANADRPKELADFAQIAIQFILPAFHDESDYFPWLVSSLLSLLSVINEYLKPYRDPKTRKAVAFGKAKNCYIRLFSEELNKCLIRDLQLPIYADYKKYFISNSEHGKEPWLFTAISDIKAYLELAVSLSTDFDEHLKNVEESSKSLKIMYVNVIKRIGAVSSEPRVQANFQVLIDNKFKAEADEDAIEQVENDITRYAKMKPEDVVKTITTIPEYRALLKDYATSAKKNKVSAQIELKRRVLTALDKSKNNSKLQQLANSSGENGYNQKIDEATTRLSDLYVNELIDAFVDEMNGIIVHDDLPATVSRAHTICGTLLTSPNGSVPLLSESSNRRLKDVMHRFGISPGELQEVDELDGSDDDSIIVMTDEQKTEIQEKLNEANNIIKMVYDILDDLQTYLEVTRHDENRAIRKILITTFTKLERDLTSDEFKLALKKFIRAFSANRLELAPLVEEKVKLFKGRGEKDLNEAETVRWAALKKEIVPLNAQRERLLWPFIDKWVYTHVAEVIQSDFENKDFSGLLKTLLSILEDMKDENDDTRIYLLRVTTLHQILPYICNDYLKSPKENDEDMLAMKAKIAEQEVQIPAFHKALAEYAQPLIADAGASKDELTDYARSYLNDSQGPLLEIFKIALTEYTNPYRRQQLTDFYHARKADPSFLADDKLKPFKELILSIFDVLLPNPTDEMLRKISAEHSARVVASDADINSTLVHVNAPNAETLISTGSPRSELGGDINAAQPEGIGPVPGLRQAKPKKPTFWSRLKTGFAYFVLGLLLIPATPLFLVFVLPVLAGIWVSSKLKKRHESRLVLKYPDAEQSIITKLPPIKTLKPAVCQDSDFASKSNRRDRDKHSAKASTMIAARRERASRQIKALSKGVKHALSSPVAGSTVR